MVKDSDKKSLVYKGSRFWVYKFNKDGFESYVLTLAFRYDCWLMIENVYPDGEVIRHWRNVGYHFDFNVMSWIKD